MKRSVSLTQKLIDLVNDLRGRERPPLAFSTMLERLAWRGASGYQTPRLEPERVPTLGIPRGKYCNSCGSLLPLEGANWCDRCGVRVKPLVE